MSNMNEKYHPFNQMYVQSGTGAPIYNNRYKQSGDGLSLAGAGGCYCGSCVQCGSGLIDSIRAGVKIGKTITKGASKLSDLATGELATSLRNALPSSDSNARAGFPGEKHAVLRLPNGKFGVANYMGPGTQLVKRLRRGDPPRTLSDKVSKAHDIRYSLAKNQKDVSKADMLMIRKLKQIQKDRLDSKFNTQMGMRPIQAKMALERSGLVKPGKIASFGGLHKGDTSLVVSKLEELEQDGYGMLPAQMLRKKLMKKHARPKSKLEKHKIVRKLSDIVAIKLLPGLLQKVMKGSGLKLAGQGGTDKMSDKHKSILHLRMLRAANNGSSRSNKNLVGMGIIPSKKQLKHMASAAGKVLLPIVIKLIVNKLGLTQNGGGFEAINKKGKRVTVLKPSLFKKLIRPLNDDILKVLKYAVGKLTKQKGTGLQLAGYGFFKDFGRGFMKVLNPALKVAKTLAPILPLLL